MDLRRYKTIFCLMLISFSLLSAQKSTVFITGTVVDSTLEAGDGGNPALKIVPVKSCSLLIKTGCDDYGSPETYFAKTDVNGRYYLTINKPEACTSGHFYVSVNGGTNGRPIGEYYNYLPLDSVVESINTPLVRHFVRKDTLKTSMLNHYFSIDRVSSIVKSGEKIRAKCAIAPVGRGMDTLNLNACMVKLSVRLSSGATVSAESLYCDEKYSFYRKDEFKGFLIFTPWEFSFPFTIPQNLEEKYPDFRKDRQLLVTLEMCDHDVKYTFPLTVLDDDIPVHSGKSRPQAAFGSYPGTGSIKKGTLYVRLNRSGTYSIDLFTTDGRLLKSVIRDKQLPQGEHRFNLTDECRISPHQIVVRIKGAGTARLCIANHIMGN